MLYEKFKDEDSFRKDFVRPLLNKLGFFLVTDFHGTLEFGKDFVFSELNRFGGFRHYGAQVKHEKTIRLGKSVDDLMTQINMAFTCPFKLPDSKDDVFISALYIFNSGDITTEATLYLIGRIRKEKYGENVYFLTGERLDALNKWATYQNDMYSRSRLIGLREQLIQNIKLWAYIKANPDEMIGIRGSILVGIETFLTSPIFYDDIKIDEIFILYELIRIIDAIGLRHGVALLTDSALKQDKEALSKLVGQTIPLATKVVADIDKVIVKLKPF